MKGSWLALGIMAVLLLLWAITATAIHSVLFPNAAWQTCGPHGIQCQLSYTAIASLVPGMIALVWLVIQGMKDSSRRLDSNNTPEENT